MPDENDNQGGTKQPKSLEGPDNQNNRAGKDSTLKRLFMTLVEVSRKRHLEQHGEQNIMDDQVTAWAERIGEVTIALDGLQPGVLKSGDRLLVEVFDQKPYVITINSTTQLENSFSARGGVEGLGLSVFTVSKTDNQVLASLRLAEKNTLYMVKYNHVSRKHYLYQVSLDQVDDYREEEPPTLLY